MCVVSNIGDHYAGQWRPYVDQGGGGAGWMSQIFQQISRQEFEDLKKDVLEMKDLLKKAKAIDDKLGQKDCEMEEKMKILRAVADAVGVNLDDVFKKT